MMKRAMQISKWMVSAFMAFSLLTGCAGGTSPSQEPGTTEQVPATQGQAETDKKQEPEEADKAVAFWTHYQHDFDFIKKKIDQFNQENTEGIFVDLNLIANDAYNQSITLAFQNNEAPDLFADGISITDFALQGYIAPLEELFTPENKERMQAYKIPGANTFNGLMYTTPFAGYNFRLVWNKDLFKAAGLDPEKPPKTFDEVRAYAKQITEYGVQQPAKQYGFMLPVGEDWIWWQYGTQVCYINGLSMFNFGTAQYDFMQAKPVLEFYKSLNEDGSLFPGCLQMANDPARAQFSEGNVGMMLAASWDVGVFNDQFPAKIDWGVTTLPTIDGVKGKTEFNGSTYLMINAGSPVKAEAMKVYEYILSPQFLGEYYAEGFGVPVYPEAKDNAPSQPTKHGFAAFADTSGDAIYPPEPFGYELEGEKFDKTFVNIVSGAVTDIDAALEELNSRYNTALNQAYDDGTIQKGDYQVDNYSPMHPTGK